MEDAANNLVRLAAILQHATKAYVDKMETTHGFLIKVRDADV